MPPRLSGFQSARLLGVGGSATVWLVHEERTGEALALKVFAQAPSHEPDLDCARRETAILGRLRHPHLLQLRDVLLTDQGPALLMEYAAGGSLHNLVSKRGRLGIRESVTLLAPIAQALAYLHFQGVRHGDVSPGNVLFTSEGKPLLADLGVGRLLGEEGPSLAGTDGFTDRSNARMHGLHQAADIYSIAAVGWYALTGRAPEPARERAPLSLLVPGVPGELLNLLEAGLSEVPEERPTAAEFSRAVLAAADPEPLDLVAVVHPSVLPELRTRRAAGKDSGNPKSSGRALVARLRATCFGTSRIRPGSVSGTGTGRPGPSARAGNRGKARRRIANQRRWGGITLQVAAFVLIFVGALLISPHLMNGSDRGLDSVAGQVEAQAPSEHEIALSPELRQRIRDDDPRTALPALAAIRTKALATADSDLLAYVNVDGTEVMHADRGIIDGLIKRKHLFRGLSVRLEHLSLEESVQVPAGGAAVSATAVVSAYAEVDDAGAVVRDVPDAASQDLVFILGRESEAWRIASVRAGESR